MRNVYNFEPRSFKVDWDQEGNKPSVANNSQSKIGPNSPSDGNLKLAGLLSSVGPGLVYAATVLGTGDVVSNTAAGAHYGYRLLWALALTLVFRYVWVSTSAKYVLVTGESLLKGYGRVASWVPLIVILSFFPIRHFANQYLMLMMGSSSHMLFPIHTNAEWSADIWSCLFTLAGFAMMFWGGYPTIERFCKVLIGIMGGSLLIAAMLSNPDPTAILKGTFMPSVPEGQGLYDALFIVMALIGTEAGTTANMTYVYFMSERGWNNVSYLKRQRFDLAIGVLCLFVMGALLQIAAAGVVHPLGIEIQDPEDLGRLFSETQGKIGLVAFALGLWGSAFSSFIGFNTGYALILTDVCRNFVPGLKKNQTKTDQNSNRFISWIQHIPVTDKEYLAQKDPVFRIIISLWALLPIYIIFTDTSAVWLVLIVAAFPVLLIPILGISLLHITNDRKLMGKYKNGWLTNSILILLILIAFYFAYDQGDNLWKQVFG